MSRKSIYLSAENEAALKRRFAPTTELNYTKAVNIALTEWRETALTEQGLNDEKQDSNEGKTSGAGKMAADTAPE